MNTNIVNDLLLKAQTLIETYKNVESYWEFLEKSNLVWKYTENEINIIWDIFDLIQDDYERFK